MEFTIPTLLHPVTNEPVPNPTVVAADVRLFGSGGVSAASTAPIGLSPTSTAIRITLTTSEEASTDIVRLVDTTNPPEWVQVGDVVLLDTPQGPPPAAVVGCVAFPLQAVVDDENCPAGTDTNTATAPAAVAYSFPLPALVDPTTRQPVLQPTLAPGDVVLVDSAGALTPITSLPRVIHPLSPAILIELTEQELAETDIIRFIDQTAPPEWEQVADILLVAEGQPVNGTNANIEYVPFPVFSEAAEAVCGTDLCGYVGESKEYTLLPTDKNNSPVDLSSFSLEVVFENSQKATLATAPVTTATGSPFAVTFTAPATAHPKAGKGRYAVRDTATGQVFIHGCYTIKYVAGT